MRCRHNSDVRQSSDFLKPLAFAQTASSYVKDTPSGPLSMLVGKWTGAGHGGGWAARAIMHRAAARWRHYRDTLTAAAAASRDRGAARRGGQPPKAAPYWPPGPVMGLSTMFSRVRRRCPGLVLCLYRNPVEFKSLLGAAAQQPGVVMGWPGPCGGEAQLDVHVSQGQIQRGD